MTEHLQPDDHLDADQLSAFLENALPAHEREQTLEHLAVCAECRSVVELALPPFEEAPVPLPMPAPKPWFTGWRLAFPLAGLAAAVLVTVLLRRDAVGPPPQSPVPEQTAIATPQPSPIPPQPTPETPKPAPKSSPSRQQEKPVPTARPAVAMGGLAKPVPEARPESPAPDQSPPASQPSTVAVTGRAADLVGNADGMIGGSGTAPAPALGAAGLAGGAGASPQVAANSDAVAELPLANRQFYNLVEVAPGVVPPTGARPLPSHLPILSVVTHGHQKLALDTGKALFFSKDDGKHWKQVKTPWPGHAVQVSLSSPAAVPTPKLAYAERTPIVLASRPPAPAPAPSIVSGSGVLGGIVGVVTDLTGAAVPGAAVTAKNQATADVRTAKADAAGRYTFSPLLAGVYELTATAPNFKLTQIRGVTLNNGQVLSENLALAVGGTSEEISVEAAAITVDTETSSNGQVIAAEAAAPESVFEVTTDSGERWVSVDGKKWKRMSLQK